MYPPIGLCVRRSQFRDVTDHLEDDADATESDAFTPSDAFQGLGDEARTAVLRALAADGPQTFSELHDASGVDTSAGFAYHLRQLDGRFVRQRADDRYELTSTGREVARGIRAGVYTESVDFDPVELDERCPFCRETALVARATDNVTEVVCEDCETPVLGLSLPPSGYATRDDGSVPAALDSFYRHRIRSYGDGVCPDCGGAVTVTIEPASGNELADRDERAHDEPAHVPVQAAFDCEGCGRDLRCPLSLKVLGHPAVVSFYRDHGEDVRDRPVWNVGSEWREHVVSRDPWCVLVSTRLDDEVLDLYVSVDGTVVEHRRRTVSDVDLDSNRASADAAGPAGGEDGPTDEVREDDATA